MGKTRALRGLALAVGGKIAAETRHVVPLAAKKWERRPSQLPKRRPEPPPTTHNKKLQNYIEQIWRHAGETGAVGDGTTFDALRNEIRTRKSTAGKRHIAKVLELTDGLENFLNRRDITSDDRALAEDLLRRLRQSWEGSL